MQNLHRKISGAAKKINDKEISVIPKGMKVVDEASNVCVWAFI
jgi:hypothetical protein